MISTSQDYKNAIIAPTRRIVPKATVDLSDPDLSTSLADTSINTTYSVKSQITDKVMDYTAEMYATCEYQRWLLDGSFAINPDDPSERKGEIGIMSAQNCGSACTWANPGVILTLNISGIEVLQAVTIQTTDMLADGWCTQYELKIYSGDTVQYEETKSPTEAYVVFDEFEVIQPTKLALRVIGWSHPYHRARFLEILPGIIEIWDGSKIYSLHVIQQADFSNLTLPYASASLEIDNTDKRFDPSNKDGLFKSITSRQSVPLFLGCEIGGDIEYVPVGVYYQQNEGWELTNDGMTMRWDLIDIIGLLSDRKYEEPDTIPDSLEEWIVSIVSQIGMSDHYTMDVADATLETTEDLSDVTCGDLLRWVCQATNTYPVSDPLTGYLHIKSLDNKSKDTISLRSQNTFPGAKSNTDIAFLTFDVGGVQYAIPGTEEISDKTVNVKNPFIDTSMKATLAAKMILQQYGGNVLDIRCRGDMSREIGDMEAIETSTGTVSGRIQSQELALDNGIMTNVSLKCLQANGAELYTDYILITESGNYKLPSGITSITLVLIGGGQGGQGGQGGMNNLRGTPGAGGSGGNGGKVYSLPLTVNDGQVFSVSIGQGGKGGNGSLASGSLSSPPKPKTADYGTKGTPTTVTMSATYSSDSGIIMNDGYVDLLTNTVYGLKGRNGKDGQSDPQKGKNGTGYGFGGSGGDGGNGASFTYDEDIFGQETPDGGIYSGIVCEQEASNGAKGGNGYAGCVLIFYVRD